jgi:hypothetical protein
MQPPAVQPVFTDMRSLKVLEFHPLLKIKKAIPLQGWTGPEGYRRLRLPDFKTIGT